MASGATWVRRPHAVVIVALSDGYSVEIRHAVMPGTDRSASFPARRSYSPTAAPWALSARGALRLCEIPSPLDAAQASPLFDLAKVCSELAVGLVVQPDEPRRPPSSAVWRGSVWPLSPRSGGCPRRSASNPPDVAAPCDCPRRPPSYATPWHSLSRDRPRRWTEASEPEVGSALHGEGIRFDDAALMLIWRDVVLASRRPPTGWPSGSRPTRRPGHPSTCPTGRSGWNRNRPRPWKWPAKRSFGLVTGRTQSDAIGLGQSDDELTT